MTEAAIRRRGLMVAAITYFRGGFGRMEFARDDAVYQQARQQVLERQYAADEVRSLDELSYELGVEKASAFYALTRLAGDHLVRRDRTAATSSSPSTSPPPTTPSTRAAPSSSASSSSASSS